jgi:hypothetical protein
MEVTLLDQTTAMVDETPKPNIEPGALTKAKILARVRDLGSKEGLGENSRPGLFLVMCEGARHGLFTKDDVAPAFQSYALSRANARGIGYKPQDSEKQQVAKLGVAVRLGELKFVNGLDVIERVKEAQAEQLQAKDGKLDYSPFDGLVHVARFQLKSPDTLLSMDVIRGLLLKPAKDEPEEADRLERILKAIRSLQDAKEAPVSEESLNALQEAAEPLETRIKELGGSSAQRKAAEKAREVAEKAQSQVAELIARANVAQAAIAA